MSEASLAASSDRYTTVAVALHWTIAALIIGNIAGGLYMHELPDSDPNKFQIYQLHKSFGITVLLLSFARLAWRLTHPAPALPGNLKPWERIAAKVTHYGFYALMIGTPLLGWAMVSASPWGIPTKLFFVVPWPHIPGLPNVEDKEAVEGLFKELHEIAAFAIIGLLLLHVAAAVKHHFVLKDGIVARMIPALKR